MDDTATKEPSIGSIDRSHVPLHCILATTTRPPTKHSSNEINQLRVTTTECYAMCNAVECRPLVLLLVDDPEEQPAYSPLSTDSIEVLRAFPYNTTN
mmetsp:Transcript_15929/g.34558  ORF Transcript_15929/g.34558 Transcript_15929/m.34558 type:complete len:97 (+) Transcript_15929:697-987(+)